MKSRRQIPEGKYMRPCPHCGEKFYLSVVHDHPDDYGEVHYGQCDVCLCRGPIAGSEEAARQQWNNRSEDKTPIQAQAVGIGEGVPF